MSIQRAVSTMIAMARAMKANPLRALINLVSLHAVRVARRNPVLALRHE